MPIFHGVGQFGSLRSPEAGAPRYVGVKFNKNFRLLYQDFDLVAPQVEEGEETFAFFCDWIFGMSAHIFVTN